MKRNEKNKVYYAHAPTQGIYYTLQACINEKNLKKIGIHQG